MDLKARLLKIYTPNPLDQCFKILYAAELQGDRRPSQLLESLLALLAPGEVDGLLFKTIFLTKLPSDIRDPVAAQLENLSSREMGRLADNWCSSGGRAGRKDGLKPNVGGALPKVAQHPRRGRPSGSGLSSAS